MAVDDGVTEFRIRRIPNGDARMVAAVNGMSLFRQCTVASHPFNGFTLEILFWERI